MYHHAYPPPSRRSYGLLGSLGRRHAQTPCDFGFIWPRNVRCHHGHSSRSWPIWSQIEVYRVENPILQETELGEYLSHIVGGLCAFALRLTTSSHCSRVISSSTVHVWHFRAWTGQAIVSGRSRVGHWVAIYTGWIAPDRFQEALFLEHQAVLGDGRFRRVRPAYVHWHSTTAPACVLTCNCGVAKGACGTP